LQTNYIVDHSKIFEYDSQTWRRMRANYGRDKYSIYSPKAYSLYANSRSKRVDNMDGVAIQETWLFLWG